MNRKTMFDSSHLCKGVGISKKVINYPYVSVKNIRNG